MGVTQHTWFVSVFNCHMKCNVYCWGSIIKKLSDRWSQGNYFGAYLPYPSFRLSFPSWFTIWNLWSLCTAVHWHEVTVGSSARWTFPFFLSLYSILVSFPFWNEFLFSPLHPFRLHTCLIGYLGFWKMLFSCWLWGTFKKLSDSSSSVWEVSFL